MYIFTLGEFAVMTALTALAHLEIPIYTFEVEFSPCCLVTGHTVAILTSLTSWIRRGDHKDSHG